MKLTVRQLKRLIKDQALLEVGPGPGMDPTGATMPKGMKRSEYHQIPEMPGIHEVLAVFSLIDPTMLTELADAALYALEGDLEAAALVLAFSVGGLGAGAFTVKLSKGFKKLGVSASDARKLADEVAELADGMKTGGKKRPPTKTGKKTSAPRGTGRPHGRLSPAPAVLFRPASVRGGSQELGRLVVRKKIGVDAQGHIFVAVDLPKGGTKMFYRSTGTGGGCLKGDWCTMNGVAIRFKHVKGKGNVPYHYFLKDPEKMVGTNWLQIADELKYLDTMGEIAPTTRFSFTRSQAGLKDAAKFNKWMDEDKIHIMDQVAEPMRNWPDDELMWVMGKKELLPGVNKNVDELIKLTRWK